MIKAAAPGIKPHRKVSKHQPPPCVTVPGSGHDLLDIFRRQEWKHGQAKNLCWLNCSVSARPHGAWMRPAYAFC